MDVAKLHHTVCGKINGNTCVVAALYCEENSKVDTIMDTEV